MDPPTEPIQYGRPLDPAALPKRKRPPRHKRGQRFIWGPIPWEWMAEAARLSCSCVLVSLVLWHLAGMRKNRRVQFSYVRAAELGVHRSTVYRALERLQRAGLIEVDRQPGRCPVVTILDAPAEK